MPYGNINCGLSEIHIKRGNTLCGQNVEFVIVKHEGNNN